MASDGPPKRPGSSSGAPRVPPPPKLSFMEEAAPETTHDRGDEPSADPGVAAELRVDINIDADTKTDTAAEPIAPAGPTVPAEPTVPQARRGVLPPPPSDGKRVHPLGAKGQRSSRAANRPSATGLPSGMRAPGVPEETRTENTDVLIASAVAALTEGDPSDNSSVFLNPDPRVAAATSAAALPPPCPGPAPVSEERKRRGFLWFGIATLAGLGVLAIVLSGGDNNEPVEATAARVVPAADVPRLPAPGDPSPTRIADASPELPPPARNLPPDLGAAWVELEDELDVGGELEAAPDVGSADDAESEPQREDGEEEQANPAGNASSKSARSRKRPRNPKEPAASSSRPPPAAPANQPPSAATLLADARKALAAGQARKAYSLASKSRSAKRTSAALVVMAKAACRFGGGAQAKSAFNQLSVTNRRGLRAECRNHGVRLGL